MEPWTRARAGAPATPRGDFHAVIAAGERIGFVGKDFAVLASDRNAARSIMVYSQAEDKIRVMDDHKLLAVGGDAADCVAWCRG